MVPQYNEQGCQYKIWVTFISLYKNRSELNPRGEHCLPLCCDAVVNCCQLMYAGLVILPWLVNHLSRCLSVCVGQHPRCITANMSTHPSLLSVRPVELNVVRCRGWKDPEKKCDIIYEIPCLTFNKTYTGETDRTFSTGNQAEAEQVNLKIRYHRSLQERKSHHGLWRSKGHKNSKEQIPAPDTGVSGDLEKLCWANNVNMCILIPYFGMVWDTISALMLQCCVYLQD